MTDFTDTTSRVMAMSEAEAEISQRHTEQMKRSSRVHKTLRETLSCMDLDLDSESDEVVG